MKAVIEDIGLEKGEKSLHYFVREEQNFRPYWHYHPEIELTYIVQGRGLRFVGDSILPYYDGDLVLIGSNMPHHWVSSDSDNDRLQKAIVIQFPISIFSYFPECIHLVNWLVNATRGFQFVSPDSGVIQRLLDFENLAAAERIGSLMTLIEHLQLDDNSHELASEAFLAKTEKEQQQKKISKTNTYILENLDKSLTVDHMAEFTKMVPQSFCRWFKKATGHSFITFLNISRIESVCQQLLCTELSVQQIAFDNGFESLSHFNRTFKKLKRTSPQLYRKSRGMI